MSRIQHLLETRFSVRLTGRPPNAEWARRRLELLRRICLPSVAAQTTERFSWLLFCDEETDPEVLAELRSEERRLPALRVALTGPSREPLAVVRGAVAPEAEVLITTRLDSDDAIADKYLEAIEDYAEPFRGSRHEQLLVNFPRGYRLDVPGRALYRGWMPNSPFHSFFERPGHGPVRTVMSAGHDDLWRRYAGLRRLTVLNEGGAAWHPRLHQHYPTHQDESIVAWLIAVHDANLVNRIPPTARRLPAGSRPAGFSLDPGLLHSPK